MILTLDTPGARLLVDDGGASDQRPVLLFLHYWGGSSATWRKVVALLDREARCVVVNQRGWGGSTATDDRYDLAAMADDVLAVIAHLELQHIVLVGHSMGGKVAQMVALRHPPGVLALVLVAPAPPTAMPVPEEIRGKMLESYQSPAGIEQALEMLAGPSLSQADRNAVADDTLAGAPGAKREWTECGMVFDVGLTPGGLTIPISVIVGSLDQVESPSRLREIFSRLAPQAHVEEIAEIGHLAPLEAPESIANACRRMLSLARRLPRTRGDGPAR